ncbi:MAG: hypothetical protein WBS20_14655, partial [Lysobacterales bacterium]
SYTPEELEAALAEILNGLSQASRYAESEAQRAYLEAERAEFAGNWEVIPAKLDQAFQTDECFAVNWVTTLGGLFGNANQVFAHYEDLMRCDPLSGVHIAMASQFALWAGQVDKALDMTSHYPAKIGFNPWIDDMHLMAVLASGKYHDDPSVYEPNPDGSFFEFPRVLLVYAMDNNLAKAREIFETTQETSSLSDMSQLMVEAALGDREAANVTAARMDARFAGPFILAEVVKGCFCGAPFDLDATPNFKARIEEAGFKWPPASPLKYPAKDW